MKAVGLLFRKMYRYPEFTYNVGGLRAILGPYLRWEPLSHSQPLILLNIHCCWGTSVILGLYTRFPLWSLSTCPGYTSQEAEAICKLLLPWHSLPWLSVHTLVRSLSMSCYWNFPCPGHKFLQGSISALASPRPQLQEISNSCSE